MNIFVRLAIILGIGVVSCVALAADSPTVPGMVRQIQEFHRGSANNGHVLRVVYFHPADLPPQKDYPERLTRIMLDIQKFYGDEMKRNGFGNKSFALEMNGKNLVIHVVEGQEPAGDYDYKSGGKIVGELQIALSQEFNLRKEFVLIFYGLCEKLGDHRYRFFAPYYGDASSNQSRGLCHAADCELMDTRLITDRKTPFFYEEHRGPFNRTLGAFNSLYIGGVAHELGHALGLPHNREHIEEKRTLGTALMGSGNYTYRHELWGEKGSFLTLASAIRLASHPLFTGSDRGRWEDPRLTLDDLAFADESGGLRITGRISSSLPVYAVTAYTDPERDAGDYDALTWVSPIADGAFEIDSNDRRSGRHELRLTFCFASGATWVTKLRYEVDKAGNAFARELDAGWRLSRIENVYLEGRKQYALQLAKSLLPGVTGTATERKLRHLLTIGEPPPVTTLAGITGDSAYLSDVEWTDAKTGWGEPARNVYYIGRGVRHAVFLETANTFFPKGLFAHAPSQYVFKLDGKWKTFEAVGGLQAGVAAIGSAVFIVKADGRERYRSTLLSGSAEVEISVDVSDVDTLELIVESGKQGNACCWSIWGNPMVSR